MEFDNIFVDPHHIFDDENYEKIREINIRRDIYVVQRKKNSENKYFLIKKGEKFISRKKNSFIDQIEKSYELIHTSILNISGFSIEKPYLYYKYVEKYQKINEVELSNENVQKIFYGIASGVSYLLLKGYNYSNFSIDSIIFDENGCPKLFDYVDFGNSGELNENELIIIYVDILKMILNMKKNPKINDELKSLFERINQKSNLPTFGDFINFFKSKSYCTDEDIIESQSFQDYLDIFDYNDKVIYDPNLDFDKESIESVCYHFYDYSYRYRLKDEEILDLNSLPEYYIKPMSTFHESLSKSLTKYSYYDDFSLIFPDLQNVYISNFDKNPFKIYIEIMKKIKELENEKKDIIYFDENREEIEFKLDLARNQAIIFLKKAFKNSKSAQIKIELAVQYVNGNILPYNLTKALNILDSIKGADSKTQMLIDQMKEKIRISIQNESIKRILEKLPQKQKEILQKAEKEDMLSLLFVGFAFYTGYNKFPILRSLSIYYYRKAAKKSPYAMYLLGYLYFKGLIFPQCFKRARNCFKRSADAGYLKAEIIDGLLRKHLCRTYLLEFDINQIFNHYLPSFKSVNPNHSLVFPNINYYLDANLHNEYIYTITLKKDDDESSSEKKEEKIILNSEKENENYSMDFIAKKSEKFEKKIKHAYSPKLLLSSGINEDESGKNLCNIAKSYFSGDNNFPINYSKAAEFFKLAADKGDSEAQWRYALMCYNSLGKTKEFKDVEKYFQDSSRQNNLRGKLYYALFLKENGDNHIFERLINECCNSKCLDALYYNAMYLENIDKTLQQSSYLYQEAADRGHIDSLIRLIYILKKMSKTDLYLKYLNLSVALLNESLFVYLIDFYETIDRNDQSNILIQIGIKMNYQLFNAYYADHLLYGKNMDMNEKRAAKLVYWAYKNEFKPEYQERYIYIILEIFNRKKDYQKAAEFLLIHKDIITTRFRELFLAFYKEFDKNVARDYYITVNFCEKEYQECHSYLMELKNNKPSLTVINNIESLSEENPYAKVILGKFNKNGKYMIRDLKKAIQYFASAAEKDCAEGYYYLGKEYYIGRILDQDYDLAKKYLLKALKDNREPRAGYYLYKISNIRDKKSDIDSLKIAASFGYKRALFKYGLLLRSENDTANEGSRLIQLAADQNYKKAVRYCKSYGILYIKDLIDYKSVNHENNDNHNNIKNESENNFAVDINENQSSKNENESENNFTVDINENRSSKNESENENNFAVDISENKSTKNTSESAKNFTVNISENENTSNVNLSENEDSSDISDILNAFWV